MGFLFAVILLGYLSARESGPYTSDERPSGDLNLQKPCPEC